MGPGHILVRASRAIRTDAVLTVSRTDVRRVFIAGHTGFIGSSFLAALLEEGSYESIYCVSRSRTVIPARAVTQQSLDLAGAGTHEIGLAITRAAPDVIVNCAGTVSASLDIAVNAHIQVTASLLLAAAKHAPGARFIQIGSAAEYGQAVKAPGAVNEETPTNPEGAYGITKLASSLLAMSWGSEHGLRPTVLRLFNLIGPRMPDTTLIGRIADAVKSARDGRNEPLVLGHLDAFRDFLPVNEAMRALRLSLHSDAAVGHIINVGSGEATRVRDLVEKILRALSYTGSLVENSEGSARSARISWQKADIRKAKTLLDWQPSTSRAETLETLSESITSFV